MLKNKKFRLYLKTIGSQDNENYVHARNIKCVGLFAFLDKHLWGMINGNSFFFTGLYFSKLRFKKIAIKLHLLNGIILLFHSADDSNQWKIPSEFCWAVGS